MPINIASGPSVTSSLQTPTTVQVYDYLYGPDGKPRANEPVEAILQSAKPGTTNPVLQLEMMPQRTTTDSNGFWQFQLIPNNLITPAGTTYSVMLLGLRVFDIQIPSGSGPFQASAIAVS